MWVPISKWLKHLNSDLPHLPPVPCHQTEDDAEEEPSGLHPKAHHSGQGGADRVTAQLEEELGQVDEEEEPCEEQAADEAPAPGHL